MGANSQSSPVPVAIIAVRWLLPPLLLVIGAGLLISTLLSRCGGAEAFAPIEVKDLRVVNSPLVIGQQGTLVDGICVKDDRDWTIQLRLSAVSDADILLRPRPIYLIPRVGQALEPPPFDPVTIKAGSCVANAPITAAVPELFQPGRWHLLAEIVVFGEHAGEVQRINRASPSFDVVRP